MSWVVGNPVDWTLRSDFDPLRWIISSTEPQTWLMILIMPSNQFLCCPKTLSHRVALPCFWLANLREGPWRDWEWKPLGVKRLRKQRRWHANGAGKVAQTRHFSALLSGALPPPPLPSTPPFHFFLYHLCASHQWHRHRLLCACQREGNEWGTLTGVSWLTASCSCTWAGRPWMRTAEIKHSWEKW